jgi:ABC-2 type transport system permease protein
MLKLITNPIGITTLARREIARFLKMSIQTIFPPIINSMLFMYVFGVALGEKMALPQPDMSYARFIVPGLMCLHLISSSYENTSSSLFIGRWHNNIQEVLLSPLSYLEMVLGILAGGLVKGSLICLGVYLVSQFFAPQPIVHPFFLIFFIITISTIFSCAGMLTALWAEDFGMLNLWNIYFIFPLVILGGVFHPISMLPPIIKMVSYFNPLYYLLCGIRYSVLGQCDQNILWCAALSLLLAILFGFITVHLFKIGYKLRT